MGELLLDRMEEKIEKRVTERVTEQVTERVTKQVTKQVTEKTTKRLNRLIVILTQNNRTDDLIRSTSDPAYQELLLNELVPEDETEE